MLPVQTKYLINGKQTDSIHVTDRGLQFGDGVFETIRIHQGRPIWWQQHMDRLQSGCQRLGFSHLPDADLLLSEVNQLISSCITGVLKIIITRGFSSNGYAASAEMAANRILSLNPDSRHQSKTEQGIVLGICTQRLAGRDSLAGIKHLNRLEQVLARTECVAQDWDEGIMLDEEGHAIEGTMSNLFIWKEGALFTPLLDKTGIKGLCREIIMSLAKKNGFDVSQKLLNLDEIKNCDGIFVTNSLIGLWPVTQYDQRKLKIIPETHLLQKELETSICSEN